jgi:hypothetical protein
MKPTLEYWQAKADLCLELFQKQIKTKGKESEGIRNLLRFNNARKMVRTLTEQGEVK